MWVACSRYVRFNWHSIIIVVMWSRWEPFIVTPFISHSHFYREKSAPVQLSLLQRTSKFSTVMRALTHTLRSCYIFGKNSISGFDGTNHQFFFRSFYDKNSWLDTETETAIRNYGNISTMQLFFLFVCLFGCLFSFTFLALLQRDCSRKCKERK